MDDFIASESYIVVINRQYTFPMYLSIFEHGELNLLIHSPLNSIDTFDFSPLAQELSDTSCHWG